MSLKSYLRTIEAQRERESKYDPKPKYESFSFEKNKAVLIKHDKVPKRKKFVIPKSAVIAIVIAATLLAVLKNPSEKEAKAEVHTFIVEKLSEKMHRNLMDDEASSTAQFESEFLMLLGSIVIR